MESRIRDDFIAVDLHVHTPSSKCYKGPKSDEEYIDILRRYYVKGVKIIAITDHNSILGYKKYGELKSKIEEKRQFLQEYVNDHKDLEKEIIKVDEILGLFNNITILPGVEFEANPGIHLLFIFDPKQNTEAIENMLCDSGYTSEFQGMEIVSEVNCDVLAALEKAKKLNGITIAAHVDSDKGIFNDLSGQYRARVFTSDSLDGISVNNVVQIEKIKGLLKNTEYQRNRPLAIIQSSDHHHKDDCGKMITYIKANERSFEELQNCLLDPASKISSTERPEIVGIIRKNATDVNSICQEIFDIDKICKTTCGLLNSRYGTIVLGVTGDSHKNIKGVKNTREEIEFFIEEIKNNIVPQSLFYNISLDEYPFGDKRVYCIRINNISTKEFYYNKQYYLVKNGELIENDVSVFIKSCIERERKNFSKFNAGFDEQIHSLEKRIRLLSNTKQNYKIIDKIEADSIKLNKTVITNLVYKNTDYEIKKLVPHGVFEGNVFYTDMVKQRENYCYIRMSCPITKEICIDKFEKIENGEAIILAPMGATHYINQESWVLANSRRQYPVVCIQKDQKYSDIVNLKSLIGYFKSSLFLYYSYCKNRTIDLYTPELYKNVYIPIGIYGDIVNEGISKLVDDIINLEQEFLIIENDLYEKTPDKIKYLELIGKISSDHNNKVDKIANEIDEIIYESLNVQDDEIEAIEDFLSCYELHTVKL